MTTNTISGKRSSLMYLFGFLVMFVCVFTYMLLLPSTAYATVTLDGIQFKVTDSTSLQTSDIDVMTAHDGDIVYLRSSVDVTRVEGAYLLTVDVAENGMADTETGGVETGGMAEAPTGVEPPESSTALEPSEPGEIIVDGSTVAFTIDVSPFATTDANGNTYYDVTFDCEGVETRIYLYQSANIPSMYIQTSRGLDFIQADKDNVDTGASMTMINPDGSIVYDNILEEIKGRGNTTWLYEKKPYQIKLGSKTDLVPGSGSAKTWILLANYVDETLIRNQLIYNLSDSVGLDYSCSGQPVDVYIDGEYRGAYYLCEKVQVGTTRVNIHDLEKDNETANPGIDWDSTTPTASLATDARFARFPAAQYVDFQNTPADYSGGYLLEMDFAMIATDEYTYFVTARGVPFVVKGPEQANANELAYISAFVQDLEDAIYSDDGYNAKDKHYSEYIDIESFARYYLVQELSANYDGYYSSTFFYKDADANGVTGKLYAGPIWDLDLSLGNLSYVIDTLDAEGYDYLYVASAAHTIRSGEGVGWVSGLVNHPEFKETVSKVWSDLLVPEVESLLSSGIQDYSYVIRPSAILNKLRWPTISHPDIVQSGNFDASIDYLTDFLEKRYLALDASEELGAYTIPAGYYKVTVENSLTDLVTPTSLYVAEGKRAALRVASGSDLHLLASDGHDTFPVSATDETGIYAFIMPGASVTISLDTSTDLGAIQAIETQVFTGFPIIPPVVVSDTHGTRLTEGIDYSLAYSNNVEAGFGNVTVTGMGSYSGSISRTFTIQRLKSVERLGGLDRYMTCARIVDEAYPDTAAGVIIATGANYPDAIAASALAGLKNYPIIIIPGSVLGSEAAASITRLHANEAIIIGGTGVISPAVITQLLETGSITHVERLSGSNRIGTSLAIFNTGRGSWSDTAIVVTGYNYADALSISPFAYMNDSPIFLTESDGTLGPESLAAILSGGFTDIVLVGGPDVVSTHVESQLGDGFVYTRLGGDDRYDTCALIADWCTSNDYLTWNVCGVATGMDFPDAISGSALLGVKGGVLLLIDDANTDATMTTLRSEGPMISEVYLFGDQEVVSEDLAFSIASIIAND
ncbi:MAG: hypothetical protein HGA54_01920 [Actinobacteria bacterium]|nr:hypothetical protein [Actinomycetota bacterium]